MIAPECPYQRELNSRHGNEVKRGSGTDSSQTRRASLAVVGGWWLVVVPSAALVPDQSNACQNQKQRTRLRSRNASRGSVVEYRNQSADVVSPAHRRPLIGAKICVARHHGRARGANRLRTALGFVQGEIGWGVRGADYRSVSNRFPSAGLYAKGVPVMANSFAVPSGVRAGSVPVKNPSLPEPILPLGSVRLRLPGAADVLEKVRVYVPPAGSPPLFSICPWKNVRASMVMAPGKAVLKYTC